MEYKEGKTSSVESIKVLVPRTIEVTTTKVNALAFANAAFDKRKKSDFDDVLRIWINASQIQ
ncbi:hypothetical protein LQV63_10365 [Paenibacillus profundus]|uniref:Uncharacterized protein n=1 Tax=Paenibacillus profundus TaxID=1173085 RepID=A0ABS8YHR4_9BACL|nr:hypothetical protein [Paenibacillus profundus]MCE5169717.1 hypothetical protein [Paenibacillus profundus]